MKMALSSRSHTFSKDTLPLSVLVVIDRGGCLDAFREELHRAAREAIDRLKPIDEIALMTFQMQSTLVQPFTTNRIILENALHNVPPHNGVAPHCFNNVLADAANFMMRASNPAGRRIVIVIICAVVTTSLLFRRIRTAMAPLES